MIDTANACQAQVLLLERASTEFNEKLFKEWYPKVIVGHGVQTDALPTFKYYQEKFEKLKITKPKQEPSVSTNDVQEIKDEEIKDEEIKDKEIKEEMKSENIEQQHQEEKFTTQLRQTPDTKRMPQHTQKHNAYTNNNYTNNNYHNLASYSTQKNPHFTYRKKNAIIIRREQPKHFDLSETQTQLKINELLNQEKTLSTSDENKRWYNHYQQLNPKNKHEFATNMKLATNRNSYLGLHGILMQFKILGLTDSLVLIVEIDGVIGASRNIFTKNNDNVRGQTLSLYLYDLLHLCILNECVHAGQS